MTNGLLLSWEPWALDRAGVWFVACICKYIRTRSDADNYTQI